MNGKRARSLRKIVAKNGASRNIYQKLKRLYTRGKIVVKK